MSLRDALLELGSVSVNGVKSFPFNDMPGVVYELPALVIHLNYSQEGFSQLTSTGMGQVMAFPEHVLLHSFSNQGLMDSKTDSLVQLVDKYLIVLRADWMLSGSLLEPLRIPEMRFGPVEHAGALYYGCRLRHRWVLTI